MKKYLSLDVGIGVAFMVFSAGFFVLSLNFPDEAQIFPQFFLVVTFVLAALLVVQSIHRYQHGESDSSPVPLEQVPLIVKSYLIILAYVLCIDYIGFYVASTVFLIGFMYFLNVRKPLVLISVTLGMDAFLYLLFSFGLKLNLPAGLLF